MAIETSRENLDGKGGTGGTEGKPNLSLQPQSSTVTREEVETQQKDINLLKFTWDSVNKEITKINADILEHKNSLDERIKLSEEKMRASELRSIEIIGIISAVIALVLVYVNQANAQKSLKESYAILITGTAGLVIFTSLLHHFFNKDDKRDFWYYFFFLIIPLIGIAAIGYFIFK